METTESALPPERPYDEIAARVVDIVTDTLRVDPIEVYGAKVSNKRSEVATVRQVSALILHHYLGLTRHQTAEVLGYSASSMNDVICGGYRKIVNREPAQRALTAAIAELTLQPVR